MLTSYFDESGHSADTDFVSIGGIVAPLGKWEIFEEQWNELLTENNLDYFRMSEFAHLIGQFKGWDKTKGEKFFARIISIIESTQGKTFGSVVDMRAYRELEQYLQASVDPYFLFFQDCVKAAGIHASFEPPEEKVAMVFEEQTEFAGQAANCFMAMKKGKVEAYERMGAFSMGEKKEVLPFIAYEMRQYFSNLLHRPNDKMRWGMEQIQRMSFKTHGFLWLDFYGKQRLLQTALVHGAINKKLRETNHKGEIWTSLNTLKRKDGSIDGKES